MRAFAQLTARAVAASVLIGLLGSSTLTVRAQQAPGTTSSPVPAHGAIYVDSASPDRNEQFLCGKTVVVMYNGLRYSNAQLAVAHSYSLPTTISLFGNVAQAANIPQTPPANASGSANANRKTDKTTGALVKDDPVRAAIEAVTVAQKAVAAFQREVGRRAAEVEAIVLDADRPEIVREAANYTATTYTAANDTSANVISKAHYIANTTIGATRCGISSGQSLPSPSRNTMTSQPSAASAPARHARP